MSTEDSSGGIPRNRSESTVDELDWAPARPASTNGAPLLPPVAQLSGSVPCGERTTPAFCRGFCRFPHTQRFSKARVPVASRCCAFDRDRIHG